MSTCRGCGAQIEWIKTENGRAMPVNLEYIEIDLGGPKTITVYDSEIYNDFLMHWSRTEIDARAEHAMPRKEVLWLNPITVRSLDLGLFGGGR